MKRVLILLVELAVFSLIHHVECQIDPRCGPPRPVAPPDPDIDTGCGTCPEKCPEGLICCPLGCAGGSACLTPISIGDLQCPPLSSVIDADFASTCSDLPDGGTMCSLRCSNENDIASGPTSVTCVLGVGWIPSPSSFSCQSEVRIDPRCGPPLLVSPPDQEIDTGCGRCPANCPEEQICCPLGCAGGSACVPIPNNSNLECPPLSTLIDAEFASTCSDLPGGRSCSLRCSNEFDVAIGPTSVTCVRGEGWVPSPSSFSCQSEVRIDSRCGPPLLVSPPDQEIDTGCGRCPANCPEGQICCALGCAGGSACVPIPNNDRDLECPPLSTLIDAEFASTCSDLPGGRSCSLRCSNEFEVAIGPTSVTCVRGEGWVPSPSGFFCQPEVQIDPRCGPPLLVSPPDQEIDTGCGRCPATCPEGQICCALGCAGGSACVPIPNNNRDFECPPLSTVIDADFASACSDLPDGTRVCGLRCLNGNDVANGPTRVACVRGEGWSPSLSNFSCDLEDFTCPPLSTVIDGPFTSACSDLPDGTTVCNLNCPGEYVRVSGPTRIACERDEGWIPSPRTFACRKREATTTTTTATVRPRNRCRRIPIPNMTYRCRRFGLVEFCSLRCTNGYFLRGFEVIVCFQGNFIPSPAQNTCVRSTMRSTRQWG